MSRQPSFVVEDQSAVIAFLQDRLGAQKRIDTHGAVVFLTADRAYKLKRAVKFPYMDFSTAARRCEMCRAEIDINAKLAPEIYLGVAPVLRRDGRLSLGEPGDEMHGAVDALVVMRRFDEEGLLDRMAERGALTPPMMAALGARIAAFHAGLAPLWSDFGSPDAYRHSVAEGFITMSPPRQAAATLRHRVFASEGVGCEARCRQRWSPIWIWWRAVSPPVRSAAATGTCTCATSC